MNCTMCVFREPLAQIVGQRLGSPVFPRIRECERRARYSTSRPAERPIATAASCRASSALPNQASLRPDVAEYVAGSFFFARPFGGIHGAAGKAPGRFQLPGIGGRIGFLVNSWSSTPVMPVVLATCCAIPRRIILQERDLIQAISKRGCLVCVRRASLDVAVRLSEIDSKRSAEHRVAR